MIVEGFEHCATRFVSMGAIGKAAVFLKFKYLLEITGKFLRQYIKGAKTLDARSVDDITTVGQG